MSGHHGFDADWERMMAIGLDLLFFLTMTHIISITFKLFITPIAP